jgi:hypothetical protein
MSEPKATYLLDLENVPKPSLDKLSDDASVIAFVNGGSKSVPKELLLAAAKLKERFEIVEVVKTGKNAMDFHIAFHLGTTLAKNAAARCVIVSKDQGFDPLVTYLHGRGHAVRRLEDIGVSQKAPRDALSNAIDRARKQIAVTPAASRPRTLKRLANKLGPELKTLLRPELPNGPSLEEVLKALMAGNVMAEEGSRLKYTL